VGPMTGGSRGWSRRTGAEPLIRVLVCWLLVSGAGWAVITAIAVYAFDRAGATGVAVVALARLISAAAAAPLAGFALERWGRARVVAVSCVAQAGGVATVGALVVAVAPLAALAGAMALTGAVAAAARPGLQALLAGHCRDEAERADATAAWSALDSVGFLLGAGLAGTAMALAGAATVCAGGASAMIVSALLVSSARAPRSPAACGGRTGVARPWDGVRTVLRTRSLHTPFLLFGGLMLLQGTTDVQLVAVADGLDLGDGGAGLMFCLWGAGGLLSSAIVRGLVRRRGFAGTIVVGAVGFGLALGLTGVSSAALTLTVAMPLTGIGFGLVETGVMGIIPLLCDDEALARVYGVSELLYGGAVAAGVVIAPVLIATFGAAHSVTLIGVGFALVTVLGCLIAATGSAPRSRAVADERARA
jgi:MFS family permease